MHRISPNNPVRRRLFVDEDDPNDQAKADNFTNFLQEFHALDTIEKTKKWNYDIKNDVPLEGGWKWLPAPEGSRYHLIGVQTDTTEDTDVNDGVKEDALPFQAENEATPKVKKDDESAPAIKKRKPEEANSVGKDKEVRRRISFD